MSNYKQSYQEMVAEAHQKNIEKMQENLKRAGMSQELQSILQEKLAESVKFRSAENRPAMTPALLKEKIASLSGIEKIPQREINWKDPEVQRKAMTPDHTGAADQVDTSHVHDPQWTLPGSEPVPSQPQPRQLNAIERRMQQTADDESRRQNSMAQYQGLLQRNALEESRKNDQQMTDYKNEQNRLGQQYPELMQPGSAMNQAFLAKAKEQGFLNNPSAASKANPEWLSMTAADAYNQTNRQRQNQAPIGGEGEGPHGPVDLPNTENIPSSEEKGPYGTVNLPNSEKIPSSEERSNVNIPPTQVQNSNKPPQSSPGQPQAQPQAPHEYGEEPYFEQPSSSSSIANNNTDGPNIPNQSSYPTGQESGMHEYGEEPYFNPQPIQGPAPRLNAGNLNLPKPTETNTRTAPTTTGSNQPNQNIQGLASIRNNNFPNNLANNAGVNALKKLNKNVGAQKIAGIKPPLSGFKKKPTVNMPELGKAIPGMPWSGVRGTPEDLASFGVSPEEFFGGGGRIMFQEQKKQQAPPAAQPVQALNLKQGMEETSAKWQGIVDELKKNGANEDLILGMLKEATDFGNSQLRKKSSVAPTLRKPKAPKATPILEPQELSALPDFEPGTDSTGLLKDRHRAIPMLGNNITGALGGGLLGAAVGNELGLEGPLSMLPPILGAMAGHHYFPNLMNQWKDSPGTGLNKIHPGAASYNKQQPLGGSPYASTPATIADALANERSQTTEGSFPPATSQPSE